MEVINQKLIKFKPPTHLQNWLLGSADFVWPFASVRFLTPLRRRPSHPWSLYCAIMQRKNPTIHPIPISIASSGSTSGGSQWRRYYAAEQSSFQLGFEGEYAEFRVSATKWAATGICNACSPFLLFFGSEEAARRRLTNEQRAATAVRFSTLNGRWWWAFQLPLILKTVSHTLIQYILIMTCVFQ